MDKLQWFKFAYADWRMGKIQRCSEITQARFINLCCLYWSKESQLSYEDAEIEVEKKHLDELIKKKIVLKSGDYISIKFLDEQLDEITKTSINKSKAAKIRWDKNKSNSNAGAMHVHKSAMQNDAEESKSKSKRRVEEIREDKKKESILLCSLSDENELSQNGFIAFSFWKLFKENLKQSGIKKTITLDKAQLSEWENDVKLMLEKDQRSNDELKVVYIFLKRDDFWKKNILTIKKLRKQFEKLYQTAQIENKQSNGEGVDAEYLAELKQRMKQ